MLYLYGLITFAWMQNSAVIGGLCALAAAFVLQLHLL